MNNTLLDTLNVVTDTVKTVADSTLVKTVADTAERTIWQDKSLLTVLIFLGSILLIGTIFIVSDVLSDRKEKKDLKIAVDELSDEPYSIYRIKSDKS